MRHACCLSALVVLCFAAVASSANAQTLPVTTSSEEAREHFELGRNAAFHYQFDQARAHLDDAINADSGFVLAYLHRGGSSLRSERKPYFDLAETHRNQVSEGERRMVDAFQAFLWEGDIERAVAIFTELSAEYSDDPYLPSYLGLRYYRNLGRYEEASEQFARALERDSSFVQAHNWLGKVAMDREDYTTAEAAFERYIQLAPGQPRPYDSLGELYLRTGRYEEAAAKFKQALAIDARFPESRYNLLRVQIAHVYEDFRTAFRERDASALAALYTEDAQLLPAGNDPVEGTAAIEDYWRQVFDSGLTSVELETREVYPGAEGLTVTEVGRYRLHAGATTAETGEYVVIWSQTPEGWRLYRDIWTSNRPADR